MSTSEEPKKESELEQLRVPVQDIIAFANTLDERYREKCFEVLLNFYLHKNTVPTSITTETEGVPKAVSSGTPPALSLPIRAFLSQNEIPVDSVGKLFLMENGEVVPTYKLKESKKAAAQVQLAMLSAFRNALINPATMFEFSIKDVRELCKEHDVYDAANFTAIFRKKGDLFNLTSDEEHVKLTPEGRTELAETIVAVSKQ